MRIRVRRRAGSAAVLVLLFAVPLARAAPWAQVGDSQLRSDIETLAAAGVIDNLTTEWPIPWGRILDRLTADGGLASQPVYVQEAAERVRLKAGGQMTPDTFSYSAYVDATNAPDIVRDFDALGRENLQSQAAISWNGDATAVNLEVGAQSHDRYDNQTVVLDGTYIAHQFGGAAVYAGYITHWWGPGWISALSLSNNARPIPQIGISRIDTTPFQSRWLSWLGPWQAEFFAGVLEADPVAHNTLLDGLRFSFNPLPGLEVGVARLDELCGHDHPCDPLKSYFDLSNNTAHPSITNDQGNIDFKYTRLLGAQQVSFYMQLMNEDSNPFWHSGTSHLFGATTWLPVATTRVRLTAEFTDSIATTNIFSFGDYIYGFSYNDYKYTEGMRYRDRSLGFSLDDDSKLSTLQASWLGPHAVTYTLTYDHADIGSPHSGYALDADYNVVSSAPVGINIGEARASLPLGLFTIDAAVRYQDDQPRPEHGSVTAVELRVAYAL